MRDRSMELRVEHGHVRYIRQNAACLADRVHCGPIVERCELDEPAQARFELVVDESRLAQLAPVHHPMGDGLDVRRQRGERFDRHTVVLCVDGMELEARRACVDNEDRQPGQVQSRISAGSSPCSRPYARARSRVSIMSWRRWSAVPASCGRRSITSMTRWNRSRSLSMTMSKGVVVVPSSLYPRTCMFA